MLIAARFALYFDLMLVFGLPLFCLYTFRGAEQRSSREIVSPAGAIALSVMGAALAVIGVVIVAANMGDVPITGSVAIKAATRTLLDVPIAVWFRRASTVSRLT